MKNITFSLLLFFAFLPLWANLKGVMHNCFNTYDLGIFQQAVYEIAAGNSLNPYLTVRGLNIFNDHFPLILFLAAPFAKALNYHPASLIVFEWLSFALFIVLTFLFLKREKKDSFPAILFSLGIIIFSKGIMSGLNFPVHPLSWSMPAWFLITYFLYKNNFFGVLLSSLLLCLFRESFTFCIWGLSFFYLINKEWKKFIILFLLSSSFILFVFVLRKHLLGSTTRYGEYILEGLVNHPLTFIIGKIKEFRYSAFFKLFYPFIIPLVLVYKSDLASLTFRQLKKHYVLAVILLYLPYFTLHIITATFHYHYGSALVIPLLLIIVFSSVPSRIITRKRPAFITVLLFITSSSSVHTKFFKLALLEKSRHCTINDQKSGHTRKIVNIIKRIPSNQTILASSGIIPRILRPNLRVYTPKRKAPLIENFNYLLLEMQNSGNTDPLTVEETNMIRHKCVSQNPDNIEQVIMDNKYYLFVKGNIPRKCVSFVYRNI